MNTNSSLEGIWKRIAEATETMAGSSKPANESVLGYMLRTAEALEAVGPIVGGGGGTPGGDTTAPTIISANPSGTFAEGADISGVFMASETVTWAKSGADASYLTLNQDTGEWSLAPTNFESGKTHYSISIVATDTAGNSSAPMTLSFTITNVFEAATLGTLSLSDILWSVGTPENGAINGATIGSTITASGLPSGLTIDSAAGTWAWSGTGTPASGSFTLTETLADSVNSPRTSTINYVISAAAQTITADYTVNNWTDLNTLIGPASATDLSNKTILVAGNANGAEIVLTNRTWPGLTITGPSAADKKLMPRLTFNNTHGASGNPINIQYLDFYNARGPAEAVTTAGQFTFDTTTSSYITVHDCVLHDDPFTTKSFKAGDTLRMYWGFGYIGNGDCDYLTIHHCEIYNVVRSILRGDHITSYENDWHDHYNHAATLTGSFQTHTKTRCWNLWATGTDTNNPHAGIAFSPSPNGDSDMTDVLIEGVVAIAGVARFNYDGQSPGASGIKFNDMEQTGFRYRRCTVRGCLLVGTDALMIEMDNGADCVIEHNTLVHDEALTQTTPSVYCTNSINVIVRNNILTNFGNGLSGRGDTKLFNNGQLRPNNTGADNLLAYSNAFVGPTFSNFETVSDALTAFVLKTTSPMYNWAIRPGAVDNYDFATGTYHGTQQAAPVSTNATSRTQQLVTKGSDVWTRTAAAGTGLPVWNPTNKRKLTILLNIANDATIDASSRYMFWTSSNNRGWIQRNSVGQWRVNLRDSSNVLILDVLSTVTTSSADGVRAVLFTVDLDQGKVKMAFSGAGAPILDLLTPTVMRQADWDVVGRQITIGNDNTSTIPGNNFVGQIDAVLIEDQFVDLGTDAGVSSFFNTSGGLVSLGANGGNPFGSTPAIFLSGTASAWNGSSFNLGDGVGGTGNTVPTKFAKGGTGAFV